MDETARLRALLDACHDVLAHLGERDDEIAAEIRRTCSAIEQRLEQLKADPRAATC